MHVCDECLEHWLQPSLAQWLSAMNVLNIDYNRAEHNDCLRWMSWTLITTKLSTMNVCDECLEH